MARLMLQLAKEFFSEMFFLYFRCTSTIVVSTPPKRVQMKDALAVDIVHKAT
jgi:hypothetical protein